MPVFEGDTSDCDWGDLGDETLFDDGLDRLFLGAREAEDLEALASTDAYMPTGWPILDEYLVREQDADAHELGIQRPQLVVLGAQPKAGKSMFTACIAEHRAVAGDWIYHCDFENGSKRFIRRMLCRHAGISAGVLRAVQRGRTHIKGREITPAEKDAVAMALAWKREHLNPRYVFCDDRTLTRDRMREHLEGLKRRDPKRHILMIVDSLQKLPMPGRSSERRHEVDKWMRELDKFTKEFDLVTICISELKRPKEGTEYQTGGAMFKESGDIEYTCDMSMLMTTKNDSTCTLSVVYSRDGVAGEVADYTKVKPAFRLVESEAAQGDNMSTEKKVTSARAPRVCSDNDANEILYTELYAKLPNDWADSGLCASLWGLDLQTAKEIISWGKLHGKLISLHGKGVQRK